VWSLLPPCISGINIFLPFPDGPTRGVFYDSDTGEKLTLGRIAKRVEKGNKLYGFFNKEDGTPFTYTGDRVKGVAYPREVSAHRRCNITLSNIVHF
jgi:hypothetical protein